MCLFVFGAGRFPSKPDDEDDDDEDLDEGDDLSSVPSGLTDSEGESAGAAESD